MLIPGKFMRSRSEYNKDMELHAIIPLLPCGVVVFVTEPGSDSCACAVRACLISFDKNGGVGDNRKKQMGAGENASIPK